MDQRKLQADNSYKLGHMTSTGPDARNLQIRLETALKDIDSRETDICRQPVYQLMGYPYNCRLNCVAAILPSANCRYIPMVGLPEHL